MIKKPGEKYMRLAIREAAKNIASMAGGPFGACIVKGGKVIAVAHNTVLKCRDATNHAEMNAIRAASKKLGAFDLSGCVIYSTTEPCPMCFSAIHWARLDAVIYGSEISDAAKIGFNELSISGNKMKALGQLKVKIIPGFLRRECRDLLRKWDLSPDKALY